MPEIRNGSFIVTLEVDAWYQDSMSVLLQRLEQEAKRMVDPAGKRLDNTTAISRIEVLGVTRKKRSDW